MGAHFAARSKNAAAAFDHLGAAAQIAVLTDERNGLGQHFGPTNVKVWRVAIGAELGLGPATAEQVEREPIDLTRTARLSGISTRQIGSLPPVSGTTLWPGNCCWPWTGVRVSGCGSWTACATVSVSVAGVSKV